MVIDSLVVQTNNTIKGMHAAMFDGHLFGQGEEAVVQVEAERMVSYVSEAARASQMSLAQGGVECFWLTLWFWGAVADMGSKAGVDVVRKEGPYFGREKDAAPGLAYIQSGNDIGAIGQVLQNQENELYREATERVL
jgi:hypothetical protein